MGINVRAWVPWWGKLGAKIVLSRLPIDYRVWAKVGIFKHGAMVDPQYALGGFQFHYRQAEVASMRSGPVVIELGPGDSLLSAPIAYAFGAGRSYLVDTGDFATRDLAPFGQLLELLAGQDRDVRELRRVLRDDGRCSHTVDLGDHLGGGLNNLRFSDRVWEGRLFSRSGFYTNRIRYAEMLSAFREAGFAIDGTTRKTWDRLPTARRKLHGQFAVLPDDDLLTLRFDVILRPSGEPRR